MFSLGKIIAIFLLLNAPHWRGSASPQGIEDDEEMAEASEISRSVSLAGPNLGALLGINNPLAGHAAVSLLQGFGGNAAPRGIMSPDIKALCNGINNVHNGGNSDDLTKLLVYQYLNGILPNGGVSNPPISDPQLPAVVSDNPQLRALLGRSLESKISTTVSTTTTVRTVIVEPSTTYVTSTLSYVTTITTLTSSVIPIIFRGSKIITTIIDTVTQVLTATEFLISSSVMTLSVIQTLPVELTLIKTSTMGLNGHYSIAHISSGPTKVIEQPISSATVDFDNGLDLSEIDLSTLDLSSFRGAGKGSDAQMVNALTALLQKYQNGNDPREKEQQQRNEDRGLPQSRFHTNRGKAPRGRTEQLPKFNVIRGFTLSDNREPPANNDDNRNSGTALQTTRYSKYHKRNKVENNSLASAPTDRESERFSASTNRRTIHRMSQRRRDRRQRELTRMTGRSIAGGDSRVSRIDRQPERNRRRSEHVDSNRLNAIRSVRDRKFTFRTTVLTMMASGTDPGETRTVILRGYTNPRFKRHINHITPAALKPLSKTATPDMTDDSPSADDVIQLLQGLDRSVVKEMLHSLKDWVDYYTHRILDQAIEPSFSNFNQGIKVKQIPQLFSSIKETEVINANPTSSLRTSSPGTISKEPSDREQPVSNCKATVTATVYQTIYVSEA